MLPKGKNFEAFVIKPPTVEELHLLRYAANDYIRAGMFNQLFFSENKTVQTLFVCSMSPWDCERAIDSSTSAYT